MELATYLRDEAECLMQPLWSVMYTYHGIVAHINPPYKAV
jgi:hypothetical protein